jgi:hypothetical protein
MTAGGLMFAAEGLAAPQLADCRAHENASRKDAVPMQPLPADTAPVRALGIGRRRSPAWAGPDDPDRGKALASLGTARRVLCRRNAGPTRGYLTIKAIVRMRLRTLGLGRVDAARPARGELLSCVKRRRQFWLPDGPGPPLRSVADDAAGAGLKPDRRFGETRSRSAGIARRARPRAPGRGKSEVRSQPGPRRAACGRRARPRG